MIELELDGKIVSAEAGSTILEVALKDGKYIPHFCYHKKLSIAANCRMCLVEVEKAPKPLPACATPITEGMKVHTCSKLAVEAQKGVMEFLLINHPLDCPICDQGGECQLQDLAVGYGRSGSRFEEEKRAVSNKDLGPLVSTQMTRCIHCSRCVRFTDEIAGYQELGMSYRNNHVEVMPFIGKTVDSEVSGNIIDICPVGALTSKPFRNQARSWELSRRKSISPHDGLGTNLIVQVDKYHKVVRVLPFENESINQCWISDRDRFSYEGLYHEERITTPRIKQDGKWIDVGWDVALQYVAKSINGVKIDHGVDSIGVLAHPNSTLEELYLLKKMLQDFGVSNLDYRLNQIDFRLDSLNVGATFLDSGLSDLVSTDAVLLVGSIIRQEQPLIAVQLRNAVKRGMQLHSINVIKEDYLCDVKTQIVIDPREIENFLLQILKFLLLNDVDGAEFKADKLNNYLDFSQIEISVDAKQIAESLKLNAGYVILGALAKNLPNYAGIAIVANLITKIVKGKYGELSGFANEVGASLVINRQDSTAGYNLNTSEMLQKQQRCYVLLNTELECDVYDSKLALDVLNKADTVIVMSPYINQNILQYADVILPITPFTETAGCYVNMEGILQKFNGVVRPLGDARPAWKVIRVLANNLGLDGFEYNNIEDVRCELFKQIKFYENTKLSLNTLSNLDLEREISLDNSDLMQKMCGMVNINKPILNNLVRLGLLGIYSVDSIVRRAKSLQETNLAQSPLLQISKSLAKQLGFEEGSTLKVKQNDHIVEFIPTICESLPDSVVVLLSKLSTVSFGGRFDEIQIDN